MWVRDGASGLVNAECHWLGGSPKHKIASLCFSEGSSERAVSDEIEATT